MAVLLFAVVHQAHAADKFWDNPSGGVFSTLSNWADVPEIVNAPGPNDVAHFGMTSPRGTFTYTVTFTNNPINQRLAVDDDQVTFDLNGHTYTTNDPSVAVALGTVSGRLGRLTITDGTVSLPFQSDVQIGSVAGSSGDLTVTTGGLVLGSPELFVGLNGNGTLNINNNGDLIADDVHLATSTSSSIGIATITGAGSSLLADLLTVGKLGTGTLNITAGGRVDSASGIVGDLAGSTSVANLVGSGSRWAVSNSLFVGRGGSGALSITEGAMVQSGSGDIGFLATFGTQGTGTATVSGLNSQWINSGNLLIGVGEQGTLNISDGGLVQSASSSIGVRTTAAGSGVVNLSGATSRWINSGDLSVGLGGTGTLNITGGRVENVDGVIGDINGDIGQGTVNVDGANAVWSNSGDLTVGGSGTGTLNITAGGRVDSNNGFVSADDTAEGHVTVDGQDGLSGWINIGALEIGDQFGAASVDIINGGQVQSASGKVGNTFGPLSVVTVDGSNAGGFNSQWVMSGNLDILSTAQLNILGGARVENANGRVGQMVNVSGPNSRWINSGDVFGHMEGGTLSIAGGACVESVNGAVGHTFTVSDPGSQWINTGILEVGRVRTGSLSITNGGRVQNTHGFIGQAIGNDSEQAHVIVDGADSEWINLVELSIGRMGNGTLTVTNGGRVECTNGFVGLSTLGGGAVSVADAGSIWTMSGQLTMRNSGGLRIRPGGTVFVAGDTIFVSNLAGITLEGGTFDTRTVSFQSAGVFNFMSGTLHVGTFGGNLLNQGGTLAPGNSAGTTLIQGSYTQQAGGTLEIEIGGLAEGTQHDLVNIVGNAALGGSLQLSMLNDFIPSAANTFTILQAAGNITGAFANIANGQRLTTSNGLGSFMVHYGAGSAFNSKIIVLSAFQSIELAGDYNQNGTVDAADYVLWRNTLGTMIPTADGNGNGTIDSGDYSVWRAHFGQTAGSGAALPSAESLSAAVPEPATLLMFLGGAFAIYSRRRSAMPRTRYADTLSKSCPL
jgi:T5SS/PEP-CTERM-associated repeat protein